MTTNQQIARLTKERDSLKLTVQDMHERQLRDHHCIWMLVRQLGGTAQINVNDIIETVQTHQLEIRGIGSDVYEYTAAVKGGKSSIILPARR